VREADLRDLRRYFCVAPISTICLTSLPSEGGLIIWAAAVDEQGREGTLADLAAPSPCCMT
jgi:hypothetical protein